MSGVSIVLRAARALNSNHTPSSSSSSSFWACPSLGLQIRGAKMASPIMSSNGSKKLLSASLQQSIVSAPGEEEVKNSTDMNGIYPVAMKLLDLQLQSQAARTAARRISWTLRAEMIVERGVVGCQSFAMIAVVGSLIGSILFFVEGCSFVLKSFFEFFVTVTQMLDRGGIIQLLIHAIDMFLMGSALLTFGMGMYGMFIESKEMQQRTKIAESIQFGLFNLKAKTRIVHALALILQTGMVDKFRNVPLTSGLDVVCLAGALLSTSATVFLLSKLMVHRATNISGNA